MRRVQITVVYIDEYEGVEDVDWKSIVNNAVDEYAISIQSVEVEFAPKQATR
jgi:nitrogen regulatory protein PII-like uncharacterized protein